MTKPLELSNAELLDALSERYGTLPWPGSLLEQPAIPFLRMQALVSLAKGERVEIEVDEKEAAFAGIPMLTL